MSKSGDNIVRVRGPCTAIIPKTRVHYYIPPTLNCAAHNQCVVDEGHACHEQKQHFQLAGND